jgi:hypothetical protein
MATQNVTVTRTGTGWTADVTACNLDPELTLKDINILINGELQPQSSYTKTTQTVLTWTGPALAADTTVDIRRSTPVDVYSPIEYTTRFSSGLWNKELDRIARRAEEYALNGVGPASTVTDRLPRDDAFGPVWDGDTIYPATRNALYDKIVSMSLAEAFGPTWATDDAAAPTRKAVYDRMVQLAPLNNANLTGSPTATTPATSDNSTRIATTAYVSGKVSDETYDPANWDGVAGIAPSKNAVRDQMELKANLSGAIFTGGVTAPSINVGEQSLDTFAFGAWTPTFIGSSSGTAPTITYGTRLGRYLRTNSLIFLECQLTWSSASAGTATGNLTIAGIPTVALGDVSSGTVGAGAVAGFSGLTHPANDTAFTQLGVRFFGNTDPKIHLVGSGFGKSQTFLNVANLSASGSLYFTMLYYLL